MLYEVITQNPHARVQTGALHSQYYRCLSNLAFRLLENKGDIAPLHFLERRGVGKRALR